MTLMLRFIAIVLVGLSAFGNACAQSPLDRDDRLNVAITLHHHVISFSDLVRDLQKQTGVTMEVQRDIMDEKATVFVENRPAREVMEKLASLFLLRWERRKGDGYRLVPDADARKWERDFLALRERTADRLWLDWIQKGYRDAQRGRGWIEQRLKELDRLEQRLHKQETEEQQLGVVFAERERLHMLRRPYGYLAAQVLGSAPHLLWQRLKQGDILIASTQPAPGELPLSVPANVLQQILEEQQDPSCRLLTPYRLPSDSLNSGCGIAILSSVTRRVRSTSRQSCLNWTYLSGFASRKGSKEQEISSVPQSLPTISDHSPSIHGQDSRSSGKRQKRRCVKPPC